MTLVTNLGNCTVLLVVRPVVMHVYCVRLTIRKDQHLVLPVVGLLVCRACGTVPWHR